MEDLRYSDPGHEWQLERDASHRIHTVEEARDRFLSGEISRLRLLGVFRAALNFSTALWDQALYESDYAIQSRVVDAVERAKDIIQGRPHDLTAWEKAGKLLGLPSDSETVKEFVAGKLDVWEARRRAEIIICRQRETKYDDNYVQEEDHAAARAVMR